MQNTQTASLDSCKCPCIYLFDCCFIQQFLFTTPLAKLTRNPELSPLLIIVTSWSLGESTLDIILLDYQYQKSTKASGIALELFPPHVVTVTSIGASLMSSCVTHCSNCLCVTHHLNHLCFIHSCL